MNDVHAVIELKITPQRDCGFGKLAESFGELFGGNKSAVEKIIAEKLRKHCVSPPYNILLYRKQQGKTIVFHANHLKKRDISDRIFPCRPVFVLLSAGKKTGT